MDDCSHIAWLVARGKLTHTMAHLITPVIASTHGTIAHFHADGMLNRTAAVVLHFPQLPEQSCPQMSFSVQGVGHLKSLCAIFNTTLNLDQVSTP